MAVCVRAVQQQDGTLLLALDPTVTNLSTCPYVVEDGSTNAWRELGAMSTSDAHQMGYAIFGVWAIAAGYKFLGRVLHTSDNEREP